MLLKYGCLASQTQSSQVLCYLTQSIHHSLPGTHKINTGAAHKIKIFKIDLIP